MKCARGMRHYACMCALSGSACGYAHCAESRKCTCCSWCPSRCAFAPTYCCPLCVPILILYQFIQLFTRSHSFIYFSLYSHSILGVVFTDIPSYAELWESRIREYGKLVYQTEKIQTKVPDSCKVFIVRSFGTQRLEEGLVKGFPHRELQSDQGIDLGASKSQEGCSL